MSAIEKYVEETEKLINQLPYRLSTKIHAENRGEVALYLRGEIVFANRSELHFREYFITIPKFRKIAYSKVKDTNFTEISVFLIARYS